MVSPGTLRALSALTDGDYDAFEPSVSEMGEITYPTAEQYLDEGDGDPAAVLESMANRDVLERDVEYTAYVCPDCSLAGMQYSTGCPTCGSIQTARESTAVHPRCDTPLQDGRSETVEGMQEETNDNPYCPDCDEDVPLDDLESDRRYRCYDCEEWFDDPAHRLWCRGCTLVEPPLEVREEPVFRYPLTAFGYQWITDQLESRQLLAEALETRGYETGVDTAVQTAAGDDLPVHVYAEDDLFDDRVVAGVHDSPSGGDVQRLLEAAREADARPTLLLTNEPVGDRIAELLDGENVTVVSAADGTLSASDVGDRSRPSNSVLDRLDSVLSTAISRR